MFYHVRCGRELDSRGWCHYCKEPLQINPRDTRKVTEDADLAASCRGLREAMDARERKRQANRNKQNFGKRISPMRELPGLGGREG